MKRISILALTIVLILYVAAIRARSQTSPQGKVYVYAPWNVFAETLRHPRDWQGRIVLVRGVLRPVAQTGLYELRAPSPSDKNAGQSLIVTIGRPLPLLAFLRRIPLIQLLVSPAPKIGVANVYRVMIAVHPCSLPLRGNQCIEDVISIFALFIWPLHAAVMRTVEPQQVACKAAST